MYLRIFLQFEPYIYQNLGDFTRILDFTWKVPDCKELVILKKNEYPVCSYEIMTIEIFFRKFLR